MQASIPQRLLDIWRARYVATVNDISTTEADFRKYSLEFVASDTGRKKTLAKLPERLIKEASHAAAARTKSLYLQHEYLQFNDTVDLSKFTIQTIPVLLQCYQQQKPLVVYSSKVNTTAGASSVVQFGLPTIHTLANHLETCFSEFQTQHSASKDWLVQCFLTSQISLTSASLLSVLDPVEQAMLKPYCDLLEEYVSIPWSQLCLVAAQCDQLAPQYQLIERMLVSLSDISLAAYRRWSKQFNTYAGPRGGINTIKIRRSSLRDFGMFQVYLWLCLLQGRLDVIEKELVFFCTYIFKGIGLPWQMIIEGTHLLLEEILSRLTDNEREIAARYADGMMQAIRAAG